MLAVGFFTINDVHTGTNGLYYGVFNGGGGHLLGLQALASVCILAWSGLTTLIVFLVGTGYLLFTLALTKFEKKYRL